MVLPPLLSFLLEPLQFLLSLTPLYFLLGKTDHFAPHPRAPFEGYYTRILTSTGSTILIIFSSVFSSSDAPHLVHFSHLPRKESSETRIVIDKYPKILDANGPVHPNGVHEFSRVAKGDGMEGSMRVCQNEMRYRLETETDEHGRIEVEVDITGRKPWITGDELSTPEGLYSKLVYLLPLHWNVSSTASSAKYSISSNGTPLEYGTGIAHLEKNWGNSFPSGWTWLQAFSTSSSAAGTTEAARTFVLAGGKIIGQKAYLLGYRSPTLTLNFRPLFTLMPFSLSTPFMKESFDSKRGTGRWQVSSFFQRLVIDVEAPADHEGWIGLNCPLTSGHRNTYAWESFEGVINVKAYLRGWTGGWRLVEETRFEDAAVEFGGDYSFKTSK